MPTLNLLEVSFAATSKPMGPRKRLEPATVKRDDPTESHPYIRIRDARLDLHAERRALRLLLDLRAVHEFRLWRKALLQVFAVFSHWL